MNSSSLPKIIFLDTVDSTNTFIAQRLQTDILPNGYCVAADYQRAGRGQQGNVWESASGQNLLFSVLLHTQHFPLDRQFVLSKVVSVAIHKFLADRGIDTKIKYPNDILYGNKKLAGILIENRIVGKQMTFSIVGVGLNINQTEFVENKATAISIRQITNRTYDTKTLLAELREAIVTLVSDFDIKKADTYRKPYLDNLFRTDGYYRYEAAGEIFEARAVDVGDEGILRLVTKSGDERQFYFKQVKFIL